MFTPTQSTKLVYLLFVIIILLPLLESCKEDDPVIPVGMCENTNYTYTLDMKLIFDTNCVSSSCHGGNNSLADYSTYEGVFEDRLKLSPIRWRFEIELKY